MNTSNQLPFFVPDFASFHDTAIAELAYAKKPYAKMQLLNQRTELVCERDFLTGYSSPKIKIADANLYTFPYMHRHCVSMIYALPFYKEIIRKMIDTGSYIYMCGMDDFYFPGKSWFHEKHRLHDGIICGYDDGDNTFSLATYDKDWLFRHIRIPQESFVDSVKSAVEMGGTARLIAVVIKDKEITIDVPEILTRIKKYLASDLQEYPVDGSGTVKGMAVYDYLDIYFDKLLDESILHEMMDWRILRIIWEYRKGMLKRLRAVEENIQIDFSISTAYGDLVQETDRLRMLYALYHRKKKNTLLLSVKNGLLDLKAKEKDLLEQFTQKIEEAITL